MICGISDRLDSAQIRLHASEMTLIHQEGIFLSFNRYPGNILSVFLHEDLKEIDRRKDAVSKKIPKGSELANMVPNDAKMVAKVAKLATNLVAKNDVNLALPPRFRQVLVDLPL
ncbi:hypothetical protein TNCV_1527741 [Trichonephila clavipes]|nr:hypothetical protein TNCV_1527741 [Trichonephila clavipes]